MCLNIHFVCRCMYCILWVCIINLPPSIPPSLPPSLPLPLSSPPLPSSLAPSLHSLAPHPASLCYHFPIRFYEVIVFAEDNLKKVMITVHHSIVTICCTRSVISAVYHTSTTNQHFNVKLSTKGRPQPASMHIHKAWHQHKKGESNTALRTRVPAASPVSLSIPLSCSLLQA